MKRFILTVALLFSAILSGAEAMKWDASNKFGSWGRPVRMTLQRKNGILVINSTLTKNFSIPSMSPVKGCWQQTTTSGQMRFIWPVMSPVSG
jgi:hypothetical protein